MRFGDLPLDEALGAILAHSLRVGDATFKKGRVLTAPDLAALHAAGFALVTAAHLEPDDLTENEAAMWLARAVAGDNVDLSPSSTGRSNLHATAKGLAVIDAARVDRFNQVNEAVTLATVAPYQAVEPRQMVATVKIITFGVGTDVVDACAAVAGEEGAIVRLAAFRPIAAALVQTRIPGIVKESVLDKTAATTRARLERLGGALGREIRCAHTEADVARALESLAPEAPDLVLVLGASAIVDRRDVVPAAVERAGGDVEHLGLPVDPGNLMLLARLGPMRVIGLPGSARSPRLHGFDWVLERLVAGLPLSGRDLMALGVGGLLKEMPGRPLPRAEAAPRSIPKSEPEAEPRGPRIAAIVLAAGRSRRMGALNKLLAEIDGVPMVTRVADAAIASKARPVVVVTGHEAERVREVLAGRKATVVHNPDYREGLSASLRRGLQSLPEAVDGVVVCLGDMPRITPAHLDRLIDGFDPAEGRAICVPVANGKRGNPVLWARRFFAEMAEIAGDVGARHLIGEHAGQVHEVEMDEDVLVDVDTPDALTALSGGDRSA